MRSAVERLLDEVGEYIDVLIMGDDLGSSALPSSQPQCIGS
jgi:hypothetical protein